MAVASLRTLLADLETFSRHLYPTRTLRRYQLEAALPILAAITARKGGSYCLVFSRQSGKDELLAQLQAFLLARHQLRGGNLVMGAPTFKPQCLISRRRLLERVRTPVHIGARGSDGYRVTCGLAGASFLSTEPSANIRGDTADLALIANEAQDVLIERWDSALSPMTASTNAPSIFSGTPWTDDSLLTRERATARSTHTLFEADWRRVADELPAYAEHVRGRMKVLGEGHPFIQTEYCLKELGSQGGMFPPRRLAQMRGKHERQVAASPGKQYALLLDVAGEDEDAPEDLTVWTRERRRDSMALTVVEVDKSTVRDDLLRRPTYRVVDRREWSGQKHRLLIPHILDLTRDVWHASWLIVDATGAGAKVADVLTSSLLRARCEVISFVFTSVTKSDLGWAFLGCIESGRYKEYVDDKYADTRRFWAQCQSTEYSVHPGPGKLMKWNVPDGKGHDDLVLSAALVATLEELDWAPRAVSVRTREDWR